MEARVGAAPYMNTESEKNTEQHGGLAGIQSHEPGQSQSHVYFTAHR